MWMLCLITSCSGPILNICQSLSFFLGQTALVRCCDSGKVIFVLKTAETLNVLPESELFPFAYVYNKLMFFRCPHFVVCVSGFDN